MRANQYVLGDPPLEEIMRRQSAPPAVTTNVVVKSDELAQLRQDASEGRTAAQLAMAYADHIIENELTAPWLNLAGSLYCPSCFCDAETGHYRGCRLVEIGELLDAWDELPLVPLPHEVAMRGTH